MKHPKQLLLLLSAAMLSVAAARAEDPSECWRGARRYDGKSDALVVHVECSLSAARCTVDLPEFGALGIPATRLSRTAGHDLRVASWVQLQLRPPR